jgi:hypothetical protein
MTDFIFDSEELENYWKTYCKVFNEKYDISKGSLVKFKKFMNEEPSKFSVLPRLSVLINNFDEDIAIEKIYNLMKYIHYDYLVNFDKFVTETEKYRKTHTKNSDDEIFYNKIVLLRSIQDGENYLKIFTKFYDYYIRAVLNIYESIYNKKNDFNRKKCGY